MHAEHLDRLPAPERAWIFALLIGPNGVLLQGIVQGGVLAYLLSLQNVGTGTQAHLIGLLSLPTSLYFLWSPVTDFFVPRRSWLVGGAIVSAILVFFGLEQPHLSSHGALILLLISACLSQLVVSSAGGMMGTLRSERARRVASSSLQAGSIGLGVLAAWVLIYLSSRVSRDALAVVAAALIGIPALAVFGAPSQTQITESTFSATMRRVWGEFKATFYRREALPYIACMTFPMGSGAAVGLLPGVAHQYGLNGDQVAWINGLLGGVLIAAGSCAMSLVGTRMRAPVLYMCVALLNSACLAILWLAPPRPITYYVGVPLYLLTVGCCYAMFTAVLLEFLGQSGKSGSSRYSIINSVGNIPVLYMLQVDGWGGQHWGAPGLAAAETLVGGMGALVLLTLLLLRPAARAKRAAEEPSAAG